jgi:hypothetical protein
MCARSPHNLGMGKCSKCCKAGVHVSQVDKDTYKWTCEHCNKPCKIVPSKHVFDESLNRAFDGSKKYGNMPGTGGHGGGEGTKGGAGGSPASNPDAKPPRFDGPLSSCCKAPVTVSRADEGTCCFICSACEKSCNLDMSADDVQPPVKTDDHPIEAITKCDCGTMYCTVCFPKGCPKCQPPAPAEESAEKCQPCDDDTCEVHCPYCFEKLNQDGDCICIDMENARKKMGTWQCGKCDGMDVPKHFRLCPFRKESAKVEKLIDEFEKPDLFKQVTGKDYMQGNVLRNDYMERVNLSPLFSLIRTLTAQRDALQEELTTLKDINEAQDNLIEDWEKRCKELEEKNAKLVSDPDIHAAYDELSKAYNLLHDEHQKCKSRIKELEEEMACCHCGTRDVGFFTCAKCETKEHEKYMKVYERNAELYEFAESMFTLGDWCPDVRKKDLIELVQKMAHSVMYPQEKDAA